MRQRITAALWALAMLAITAPLSWGQSVTLTAAKPAPGDTNDHIDLAVHRGPTLQSAAVRVRVADPRGGPVSSYAASWASSDPAIATVVAGQVQAKAAGVARITVNVSGGAQGAITVCVSDSGAGVQPIVQQWPAVSAPEGTVPAEFVRHQPPVVLMPGQAMRYGAIARNDTTPGYARYDAAIAGKPWPLECLHWRSTSPLQMRVDRRGLAVNVTADTLSPIQFVRVRVGPP